MPSHLNLGDVLGATRLVHEHLDLAATLQAIVDNVPAATGFTAASVGLRRPDGDFENVAVHGGPDVREALLGQVLAAAQWESILEAAADWDGLYFVPHDRVVALEGLPTWRSDELPTEGPQAWHPDDLLCVPLLTGSAGLLGFLSVDMPRDRLLPNPSAREILRLFAEHAAAALENALIRADMAAHRERLEWAAHHDHLTGLRNRTVLEDSLPAMSVVPDQLLLACVLDFNGFKRINDTAGHRTGDEVLAQAAARMGEAMQEGEVLARLGGDEFLAARLVPSNADPAQVAAALVARLRAVFAEPFVVGGTGWRLDVSIGTAHRATPVDPAAVIAEADRAMYDDKRTYASRRNR